MTLLDTDVVSSLMRSANDAALQSWFNTRRGQKLSMSTISIAEITFGLERSPVGRKRAALAEALSQLIEGMDVIDVTRQTAAQSGAFRARREALGRPIALADALIAATAHVHDLEMATRNIRDFEGLGLALVNPWKP